MIETFSDFIRTVMARQVETRAVPQRPESFWRDLATGHREMTDEARLLLLGSPENRRAFLSAYKSERDQALRQSAANLDVAPRLRHAASGTSDEVIHIDSLAGGTLTLRPLVDGLWQVRLDLGGLELPPMVRVSVRDDIGRIWMDAVFEDEPVLMADWPLETLPRDAVDETETLGFFVDGHLVGGMRPLQRGVEDGDR